MMNYKPKYFDLPDNGTIKIADTLPYVFSENITIAVDVALATNRPLLVAGPPGCGKSRLSDAMAAVNKWNLLSHTMTSRTRLEELTGEPDHLQRLHDAHARTNIEKLANEWAYLKPGIFWWTYDPESAKRRGGDKKEAEKFNAMLNYPVAGNEREENHHTVLLLDEIDKAEPDLPNDLLEPLDRRSFVVPNGGVIKADKDLQTLTIITTNQERELPAAFLRRCVTLTIEKPDTTKLIQIGHQHYPDSDINLITKLAERIEIISKEAPQKNLRAPGTSELLDAIHACNQLGLKIDSNEWKATWPEIERTVLIKDIRVK